MLALWRNPAATVVAAVLGILAVQFLSVPSQAQGRFLESYTAFLGPNDHFNSRGTRLTQPWQIIRQDRANVHRFGRGDQGDEWDSYFGSANNRARMERMILNGYIEPNAAWRIVNQNVWVHVEIYENAVNVTVR